MKLSAEEIKERIAEIRNNYGLLRPIEDRILKLIEDATGEKIPEPFDESKVVHGSVWRNRYFTALIVQRWGCSGTFTALDLIGHPEPGAFWPERGDFGDGAKTRLEICTALKSNGYSYAGQFDFSKGLPEGAK